MLGNIEFYGTAPTLGGLVVGGWIDIVWANPADRPTVTVTVAGQAVSGPTSICLYPRADLDGKGRGFVLLLDTAAVPTGAVEELSFVLGQRRGELPAAQPALYDEDRLIGHARHALGDALPSAALTQWRQLLDKPRYTGVNTLPQLPFPLHVEVDQASLCPPDGLLLRGWLLDPFARLKEIRLRSGTAMRVLDRRRWVAIARQDVADVYRDSYGPQPERCGYLLYAAGLYQQGEPLYFEVETVDGEIGYRPLPPPVMTGLPAIKAMLGQFALRRDELRRGYDEVVGPAIEAINGFRLRQKPEVAVLTFGAPPVQPRVSLVIPLHGRIDFMEVQLALFADGLAADHEIVYVLDDPTLRSDAEVLAAACFARFRRPFALLLLGHGVGYAPANNIGLDHASGEAVCFLNSDVFPLEPDWLELMWETLQETRTGIVGACLYYEDGTLQHDGCVFERLPDFAGWPFPMHPGKGRRVPWRDDRRPVEAVTGACMLMPRRLAEELGGFDEGFVVGDFEDADLCLRAAAKGHRCVVDGRARLHHLERQSQDSGTSPWRMNLTLYNAWRFQARWSAQLPATPSDFPQ